MSTVLGTHLTGFRFTEHARYRIYTEDCNRDFLTEVAEHVFGGATLSTARGVWEGSSEDSIVLEVITDTPKDWVVALAADLIRVHNQQAAVLVTRDTVSASFVGS